MKNTTSEKTKYLFFIIVFLTIVFVGLRYQVGHDWNRYLSIFNNSNPFNFFTVEEAEPLFTFIAFLFNKFNLPFVYFIFFIALLSISLKSFIFYKYSNLPFLLLFFYFPNIINGEMGQIRQFLALGLTLFSTQYIITKKFNLFLLLLFIASFVHFSAFFFFPVYFLVNYIKKYWTYFTVFIIAILFNTFSNIFLFDSVDFLPEYLKIKYLAYYLPENGYNVLSQTVFFRVFLILFIYYLYKTELLKNNFSTPYFLKIYFWGIILFLLLGNFPTIADRGVIYFKIYELFMLTNALFVICKKYGIKHLYTLSFLLLSTLYFFRHTFFIFTQYFDYYVPYQTWLFR